MEKQLNFLNIFDEENGKKDFKDETKKAEELNVNTDIKKEAGDKTESQRKELESFLLGIKGRMDKLSLSAFEPFLSELNNYHERFQSFRKQYQAAKPGLEKETIYRKIVSPDTEDEPEFRAIAALYLIYLEKLKEFRVQTKKQSSGVDQRIKTPKQKRNTFWSSPKLDQGKDAAAGAYLDYKDE